MSAQIKISGVYQLKQRMKRLQVEVRDRGLKKAVKAGAMKIAEAARENAARLDDPKTPENISLNVTAQYAPKVGQARGGTAYRIGVMGGAKSKAKSKTTAKALPGGETFYWRFLEFGTSKMAARPFMRPAMERGAVAAEEVATVLEQFLDRTVPTL